MTYKSVQCNSWADVRLAPISAGPGQRGGKRTPCRRGAFGNGGWISTIRDDAEDDGNAQIAVIRRRLGEQVKSARSGFSGSVVGRCGTILPELP